MSLQLRLTLAESLFPSVLGFLMGFQPSKFLRERDFVIHVSLLSTDFCFHFPAVCDTQINRLYCFLACVILVGKLFHCISSTESFGSISCFPASPSASSITCCWLQAELGTSFGRARKGVPQLLLLSPEPVLVLAEEQLCS